MTAEHGSAHWHARRHWKGGGAGVALEAGLEEIPCGLAPKEATKARLDVP
jgi:hypothetical protein